MTKNIENLTILYFVKCGVLQGVLQGLRKNRYLIFYACLISLINCWHFISFSRQAKCIFEDEISYNIVKYYIEVKVFLDWLLSEKCDPNSWDIYSVDLQLRIQWSILRSLWVQGAVAYFLHRKRLSVEDTLLPRLLSYKERWLNETERNWKYTNYFLLIENDCL